MMLTRNKIGQLNHNTKVKKMATHRYKHRLQYCSMTSHVTDELLKMKGGEWSLKVMSDDKLRTEISPLYTQRKKNLDVGHTLLPCILRNQAFLPSPLLETRFVTS